MYKVIIKHDRDFVIEDLTHTLISAQEYFDIDFPEGEYESIGGFIIHILGRIPKSGEKVSYENLEILTESADERKIHKIRVTRKTADEDG